MGALVLSGGVAALAVMYLEPNSRAEHPLTGAYSTAKGQHGCWKLPDRGGSEVCLNSGSDLRYTITPYARNIELLSGEAVVTVAAERRPLEVLSNGMLLRDVSTRFDIRRNGSLSILTVIQGAVRAKAPINEQTHRQFDLAQPESAWESAREFHQLQQVEFDASTGTLHERRPLTAKDLSQFLTWQRGVIDPSGKSLSEVLEQFGRYQSIEKFKLPDELRTFPVPDGELIATDLSGFLRMLESTYGIQHTLTRDANGDTIVNLWRPRNGSKHLHRK